MFALRLLGAVDLVDSDGRQAAAVLAQRKQVALLAVLVLTDGGTVRRDRLMGLLWPELPTDRARNALSKALHGLRATLGAEALPSGPGDEIGVSPHALRCDVLDLLSALDSGEAEEALPHLVGAELLEGFHLGEAQAFEEWLEDQRRRLRRRALEAALGGADAVGAEEHPSARVRWLEWAAALQPFDEELLRRLVTAHAQAGDRARAVVTYQRFAERLASELDVEPSLRTRVLVDGIRAGELESDATAADRSLPDPADSGPLAPRRSPLSPSASHPASGGIGPRGPRWPVGRIAAVGVLILVLAGIRGVVSQDPASAPERRVLVAPLELDTTDAELAGFGLVAADWLTLTLSQGGAEVVPARVALARLAGGGTDHAVSTALAREVGARWVVSGQVRRVADSIVVFPLILDPERGVVAQALVPVGGPASDPGALLVPLGSRLSGALAARLDVRVPRASTGPAHPPVYAAYLEYVDAIALWARAGSGVSDIVGEGDFARAADHFRRARALDPDFLTMLPWMWEALTLSGAQEEARRLLDEIVARREELGGYEMAVVDFLDRFRKGDREGAYRAARRRVELAPYDGDAQWSLGWAAVTTNRFHEGLRAFEAAEDLGGWMGDWANFVQWPARALHLLGEYDDEANLWRRFIARFPELSFCDHALRPLLAQHDSASFIEAIDRCVGERMGDRPATAELLLGVSMELRAHGHPELARRYADSVVALLEPEIAAAPELRGLRRIRFEALMVSDRWEELLAAAEGDPEPHVVWVNRWGPYGVAAARLGDSVRVEAALARIRESASSPSDAWAHLRTGSILAHLGRFDDAIVEIQAAVAGGLSPAELFHAQRSLEPLVGYPAYDAIVAPRR